MTSSTQASPTPASDAAPGAAAEPLQLDRLGLGAGHAAIVGLQWGDEGKGKVVDLITGGTSADGSAFGCVVRYNGGANAGHSLQVGDQRYALHLIPSGILYPDKVNVLGNGVVIDLAQIVKEITELRERGLGVGDNLRISDRAHVVMPWHKVQDVLYDEAVAQAWESGPAIGTTGRGIGPCYADKALRSTAIRVSDLLDAEKLHAKVMKTCAIKNVILAALAKQCGRDFEPFDGETIQRDTLGLAETLRPHITDTAVLLHDAMGDGKRLLFEGANATLLDIDHGTYPYVTSSNCSSLGVHTGTGAARPQASTNVVGVVEDAYQTRASAAGPMPTELERRGRRAHPQRRPGVRHHHRPAAALRLAGPHRGAVLGGSSTAPPRIVLHAAWSVLSGLEELKVCVAYDHRGTAAGRTSPPDCRRVGRGETPVYETLPGFSQQIRWRTAADFDELPGAKPSVTLSGLKRHVGDAGAGCPASAPVETRRLLK